MKTEYNAKTKSSDLGVVPRVSAHECPTPQAGENVRRTEKFCNNCKKTLLIECFYFKRTQDCYFSNCKDCIKAKQRQYTETNKDKISEAKKEYYKNNTAVIKSRRKTHNVNRELKKQNRRLWENKRLQTDIGFRLSKNMRKRIFNVMKAKGMVKSDRTEYLIGCPIATLVKHIESLFLPGMSWENYGAWHVDHILPLSKFDLTNKQDLLRVMNYKNLQPLWAVDNIKKGAKVEPQK